MYISSQQKDLSNLYIIGWHHLLKGKFLEGKQNQWLDHLIHTLIKDMVPDFRAKHDRQQMGFEGIDIEAKLRSRIEDVACVFPLDDIEELEDEPGIFTVKSQSTPNVSY